MHWDKDNMVEGSGYLSSGYLSSGYLVVYCKWRKIRITE